MGQMVQSFMVETYDRVNRYPCIYLSFVLKVSPLIGNAEECRLILGVRICQGVPSVSHLLFVDDCVLFFKAEES